MEDNKMRKLITYFSMVISAALLGVSTVSAGEIPETQVTVIGTNSTVRHAVIPEKRFWSETLPKITNGKITANYNNMDLMGIKGFQVLRLLKAGVTDFGSSDVSKLAGDNAAFEGCDLAGLALDVNAARAICDAWKPTMDRIMQKQFNTKLLATGANPPQVFWCRDPINQLSDLKGRKIRVFNKTMSDFVNAVGGTTISMAFAEVVPALQRGVVDCAVTGTTSGNSAGWTEVSDYIYPMYLGWSVGFQGVNLDSWNRLGPDAQGALIDGFKLLEDDLWATVAVSASQADNCNTGKDPCDYGKKAKMTIAPVKDADKGLHKELMENVVLVEWGKRCGKDCVVEWNNTIGKVVGMAIPIDKI